MKTYVTGQKRIPVATSASLCLLALLMLPGAKLDAHDQQTRFFRIVGQGATTITAISPEGDVTWTNELTNVTCMVQVRRSLEDEIKWADYVEVPVSNHIITHRLFDPASPTGMALVPAGTFMMGDTFGEGGSWELPTHTVYISAFYMDRYEVTKSTWDATKAWAALNGYGFDNAGLGKGTNHPVQTISWHDAVKWCNARSQMEGLVPCYYTDAGLMAIYTTGQTAPYVKWDANGYRLPTEAEWEKAARGGARGQRFPWSHADTITHSEANYSSSSAYAYDLSPTSGYHPNFINGSFPFTSPVGSFAPNGYELHDMAGNVWEWCWDWMDGNWYAQPEATQNDTPGPIGPLGFRAFRGGSWFFLPSYTRCAYRYFNFPTYSNHALGFRCVRRI